MQYQVLEKPLFTQTANLISLSNQPYLARPTLIDLNPGESRFYPVMGILDSFTGSWTTLDALCDKICAPNKTQNVN